MAGGDRGLPTLLVPDIALDSSNTARVESIAIVTTHRKGRPTPGPITGQVQS
jgi:hypothetical protein